MSNLVLVDSSFWIRMVALRRNPFEFLAGRADDFEFAINGVIWTEVIRGRADPNLRSRFEQSFSTMLFLSLSASSWSRVAALAWKLDCAGCVIGLPDLAIASTALENDASLLTFDRHFQAIPGLQVVDDLD